jgi:hypothetical protein
MTTQADLYAQLQQARDPDTRRDRALALLAATRSREYVDAALRVLEADDVRLRLGDDHRTALRDKALYYFAHEDRDRGGLIRAQIVRLLAAIGHPGDSDLFRRGVDAYATPNAQNLRAAALRGLVRHDAALASAHAVRLLGEPDTSPVNGEPSFTALAVLVQQGHLLPIYGFVLRQGQDFIAQGMGEIVGKALELLPVDFPVDLYAPLAESFVALDAPAAISGVANAIVEQRIADLYPLLERIITGTRHDEVHRYVVILLAASRDDTLIELLFRLAKTGKDARVMNFIEAVELTPADPAHDDLLRGLDRRL